MTTNKRSSSNQAKGRHSKYLHRHRWSDIDGEEMKEFRTSLSSKDKTMISATAQGEDFGYRYAQEQLGYEDILHPDEKSIRQGYDHLCRDPENGDLVVMEYKGQNSEKSNLQKREDWTAVTAEKILESKLFPYRNVSEYERQFAEQVREALERGERVRYEVVRTYANEKTGDFWTQLEESKLIEKELNADGEKEKINTFDYFHPKQYDSEDSDDKNQQNERDELDKDNDENDERSEFDEEPSGEKVNPFESYYPEYFESTDEANEFDELNDPDENDEGIEVDEPSSEKVNPFEYYYPEYFESTNEENTENVESKYDQSETAESDEDDD